MFNCGISDLLCHGLQEAHPVAEALGGQTHALSIGRGRRTAQTDNVLLKTHAYSPV